MRGATRRRRSCRASWRFNSRAVILLFSKIASATCISVSVNLGSHESLLFNEFKPTSLDFIPTFIPTSSLCILPTASAYCDPCSHPILKYLFRNSISYPNISTLKKLFKRNLSLIDIQLYVDIVCPYKCVAEKPGFLGEKIIRYIIPHRLQIFDRK